MGSLFSSPPSPPPIPVPPPSAAPPTLANAATAANATNAKSRAIGAATTEGGTVGAMGPEGLQAKPMTAGVTLLGGGK